MGTNNYVKNVVSKKERCEGLKLNTPTPPT